MAVQRSLVSNQTLPVGVSTSAAISIPGTSSAKTVEITIDASNYIDGTTILAEVQINTGDGWNNLISFGATQRGLNLDGTPASLFGGKFFVANPLPDCQVRGRITIGGNPLLTTIIAKVS